MNEAFAVTVKIMIYFKRFFGDMTSESVKGIKC